MKEVLLYFTFLLTVACVQRHSIKLQHKTKSRMEMRGRAVIINKPIFELTQDIRERSQDALSPRPEIETNNNEISLYNQPHFQNQYELDFQNQSMHCADPRKEYRTCGNRCPKTCEFSNGDPSCQSITIDCQSGCYCKDEFLQNEHGFCVKPHCCTLHPVQVCGPDREYNECGSACPPSCSTLNLTTPCIFECKKGCFCKSPNVEDGNGNCIDPCHCPKPQCTEAFRQFESCRYNCPKTCNDLDTPQENIVCYANCIYGCFCKPGYVEVGVGSCITESECRWMKSLAGWFS